MARYTTAYSGFISRLGEVEALRKIALGKERQNPVDLRHEINALCRGSIVLLSSYIEAYIKGVGELALDSLFIKGVLRTDIPTRFFYHISKNHLDELYDSDDPEKIAEKVFLFLQEDITYWSRMGTFPQSIEVERFNKGFSTPTFKKIKPYFNRFGYSSYNTDLSKRLRGQFQPITNMIDHLVDTRNKIAHGDPMASKTPTEIKEMINMAKKFCAETDTVFAAWWKLNFCSIR